MTQQDIYETLTEIFHDVFMRDDLVLRPDLSAPDVEGWDSFKQIEIILAVEARFGFKAPIKEIEQLNTVGDLVSLIQARAPA
jgi:acyl carrier protein